MDCPNGLVYKACMPTIQAACGQAGETSKPDFCFEGCDCIDGLVMDDTGKCIDPSTCPCTYHNKLYSAGSTIPNDCNSWYVRNLDKPKWLLPPNAKKKNAIQNCNEFHTDF